MKGIYRSWYWSFVRGIHRSPVDYPHKGPVTYSFDIFFDVSCWKTVELLVIWDATKLMWRHCYERSDYIPATCIFIYAIAGVTVFDSCLFGVMIRRYWLETRSITARILFRENQILISQSVLKNSQECRWAAPALFEYERYLKYLTYILLFEISRKE